MRALGYSERRICKALGVSRNTVRYFPQPRDDEDALTADILRFAGQYGRYDGYRRVHALLRSEGWEVSHGRVMRTWQREGLKVPQKQLNRGRLWLNDGSCIRLRPERRNPVWSWDFVFDRTHDGRPIKLMVVIGEYTRECLAVHVARRIRGKDAIDVFADLMQTHGIPEHIRSDNCPEIVAKKLRNCLGRLGINTMYYTSDSPWENSYCESFTASSG